jgi:hypothetical protein
LEFWRVDDKFCVGGFPFSQFINVHKPAKQERQMKNEPLKTPHEYCVVVEGNYFDESEAEHALRDPFIEEWVEQTGSFRIHNFDEIEVAAGIALGWLAVKMVDDEIFEITCNRPDKPLTEHKAKLIAEALRRQDMFDEISVEPCAE